MGVSSLNIVIAGGGIGGLTAALCIAKVGYTVTVLEQAERFSELGAGIQLSPNATRVLSELGLEKEIASVSFRPQATEFRGWRNGRVISTSPLGDAAIAAYGSPYFHIHRADLLNLLLAAAQAEPKIDLHTSARLDNFAQKDKKVFVNYGASQPETLEADVLIGADGIHSTVNGQLWGEQPPHFTGNVAYRAMVPAAALPKGRMRPVGTVWWGPGKHFVHYFVRGGEWINCVCVVEQSQWVDESWTQPAALDELRDHFRGWHDDLHLLFEHIDQQQLYRWGLFDRDPMPRWSRGQVSLLGDACHPTLPFMAQGAAMAIEDAKVLARCLNQSGPIEHQLQRYEALRKRRTAAIQLGSRRNSRIFHLRGLAALARNFGARFASDASMRKLYAYDANMIALDP